MKKMCLSVVLVLVFANALYAQQNLCDIEGVGTLTPNELKAKTSILHTWQGAWGGVNTDDADRIIGLYDFDLNYLLAAMEAENKKGDYTLIHFSTQASFGNGLSESKVDSIFNLNEAAKGDNSPFIDKFYMEQTIWDRLFVLDIGKLDMVDFFDTSAVANCEKSQFFASPFVNNTTIPFPSKGLGTRLLFQPCDFWYVQAAVADAEADKRSAGFTTTFDGDSDYFTIGEIGIRPNLFGMPGTYRFIGWYDPRGKTALSDDDTTIRDDSGCALSFDQKLTEKFTGFVRYGWADKNVNEMQDFVSFGGQIEGLFDGRDKDVFGIAYGLGVRSPLTLSDEDERYINLVETYYNIEVNKYVHISPDVQLVMNPGGLRMNLRQWYLVYEVASRFSCVTGYYFCGGSINRGIHQT